MADAASSLSFQFLLLSPSIGMTLSTLLVGIVAAQIWAYFYREDNRVLTNITVIILSFLIIASDGLDIATAFNLTIVNWGNVLSLLDLPRFLTVELIVSGIVMLIVDVFFASRIYNVNRLYDYIAYALILMSIAALVCGCVAVHLLLTPLATISSLEVANIKSLIDAQNFLRLGANLLSSGAIAWNYHSNYGMTIDNSPMFHRVLQFIVSRGVLLILFQIITAAVFAAQPQYLRWTVYQMMLDKVYVITMMAMLNSRPSYRGIMSLSGGNPDLLSRSPTINSNAVSERAPVPEPFIIGGPISRPTSLGAGAQTLLPFRISDAVPGPSNTSATAGSTSRFSYTERSTTDSPSRGPPPEVNRATRLVRTSTLRSEAQSDAYPPSYRSI